jgi:hypothetical protein
VRKRRAGGISLLVRTRRSSGCAGDDEMTAPPGEATAPVIRLAAIVGAVRAYART